jgi:acetyl-CoA carboxylase biotin carboxyl carrier protein
MKKRDSKTKTGGVALKVVGGPATGGNGGDSGIDFESVRVLARIATEFDLSEIEVDRSGHMRVRRGGGGVAAPAAAPAPAAAAAPAARPIVLTPAATPVEAGSDGSTFISSPFVGTFYRAPSPEAPSFVEAGQQVRKGQVVCIVEAMKLMNEIEAEAEGRIAEILVENGAHVEYGQHLFRVTKT